MVHKTFLLAKREVSKIVDQARISINIVEGGEF